MAQTQLDLKGSYAIRQGMPYTLTIRYPGNITGAIVRGQIRKGIGGALLANWAIGALTYDAVSNYTTMTASLTTAQTQGYPFPLDDPIVAAHRTDQGLPMPPRGTFWVYGIEGELNTNRFRILQGKVEVDPEVVMFDA
jgi:hypothetical protein